MLANDLKRTEDVILGNAKQVVPLYSFPDFPVNMLSSDNANVSRHAMDFGISPYSGVIQLTSLLPKENIYIDSHSNAVGGIWKRQHEALAGMIEMYTPQNVLEIGEGTGILEKTYNRLSGEPTRHWYIVEPEPNPIDTKAEFIKGFFPDNVPRGLKFDLLVHSHLMEHIYNPREFMHQLSANIALGRHMVFSVPNLKYLLEQRMTSVLNFEHTVYLTEDYVEYLLAEYGFKVERKSYFENHSIMYATTRIAIPGKKKATDFAVMYEHNKRIFEDYMACFKTGLLGVTDFVLPTHT